MSEASGAPVEGEHAIGVRLVAADGTVLWTDTFITTLNAGYYHLVLGAQMPLEGALFQGASPRVELTVDGGEPIPASGPIAHVPYAAVADHARTADHATLADGLVGGDLTLDRLEADAVLGAHHEGDTAIFGTVQAGRVNAVVALGAGEDLDCAPANRGVLRYPLGGPLQVCSMSGWADVGAAEGQGTCSIVGECPDGGEPSRVWFDDLALLSVEAVEHLCARYDRALGGIRISGVFADAGLTLPAEIPCIDGSVADINSQATAGTIMPLVDTVTYDVQVRGRVEFAELHRVGRNLQASTATAQSTLPSLTTVGGNLGWSWASGTDASLTLPNFLPALETVAGNLGSPASGPLVPLPNLVSIGGDFNAPTVDVPNLRTVGGALRLAPDQRPLPAVEEVGSLGVGAAYQGQPVPAPAALSTLTSLRRINGNLGLVCIAGWEEPELQAFVDRIGEANITGRITLLPASDPLCHTF